MDKLRKQAEEQRKEQENTPMFNYLNHSSLPFPQILKEDMLNDNAKIDNILKKIDIEMKIIEEQQQVISRCSAELLNGKTEQKTPDGSRLMNKSELLTLARVADVTIWQSKSNVEQKIQELMKFVDVPIIGSQAVLLSMNEHNDIAMAVIDKAQRLGVLLFGSNKAKILESIKA